MVNAHRLPTTGALIVCLVGAQWNGTLFAKEEPSPTALPSSELVINGSEPLDAASAGPATATSVSRRPDSTTDVSSDALTERLRFTLNDKVLTENAPAGPAGGQVWRSPFEFAAVESGSFAQRDRYRGRRGDRNRAAQAEVIVGAIGSITGAAILVYANRPECRANQSAGGCGYGTKVVGGAVLSAGAVGLVVGAVTWR